MGKASYMGKVREGCNAGKGPLEKARSVHGVQKKALDALELESITSLAHFACKSEA